MTHSPYSFSYVPFPQREPESGKIIGEIFRPLVVIRILYKHQLSRSFDALVDSGSDTNLFPAEIGEMVGINFRKRAPNKFIMGIGKQAIEAFTEKVSLYIGTNKLEAEVDFSYNQQVPLLGRNGFFNLFKKVTFREQDKFVDLYLD